MSTDPANRAPGWPADAESLGRALTRLAAGLHWRAALEELLVELEPEAADRLMQLSREGRGAWIPLLAARGGRALLIGNALSGTSVALGRLGFTVVVLDHDALRLGLALARGAALAPGMTQAVRAARERLPFADGSFDLVVAEDGAAEALDELRRVARGELALVVQNRLAYKSNDLRRGRFEVPSPWRFLARALRPDGGERTLAGWRRRTGDGARAFALYPHSDEFSHVVGLDGAGPRLYVGPKERGNPLKVLADRAGLFGVLTPSFLLLSRAGDARPRIAAALDELSQRTGEGAVRVAHWIATRGLSAVLLTEPRDGSPGERGRWCVHVPLEPSQDLQIAAHVRTLALVRREHPGVPVPEPLFEGRAAGLYLSCERRLGGLGAPQLSGDRSARARLLGDAARHLALLARGEPEPCDELAFERLLGRRFALVASHARVASTLAALERMRAAARAALLGTRFPRVLMHHDLRGKHVAVEPDGRVLGYLDWGTADPEGLPLFDLFHLVVHERKQALGLTAGEAWRQVREHQRLEDDEQAALDGYARALALDPAYVACLGAIYPVLVAAMAETHWNYSRPRWLHREFGL
jgi:aminoglycoside phosphotransferase (APT) family kinase protein